MNDKLTLVSAMSKLRRGPGRGFTFVGRDRTEHYWAYESMEEEAHRRAAFLQAMGIGKGDRIALVIPEPNEFVLTFLGATVAGAVPVPIYPRASFKNADSYVDILAHVVGSSGAKIVFCMEGNREIVKQIASRGVGAEILDVSSSFEGTAPSWNAPLVTPDDLCFLQFTSGSTSKPKGVMVTHGNLVANASAFLGPNGGLDRNDEDKGVSWLPLFHDMGLIGFVLGTLICDIPVVLLPTETFARSPGLWLETITKHRGTITYAPNFAYQLVTKRVKDRQMAELDLSSVRVAGCGAEPIRARTLLAFAEKFAPDGLSATSAFLPSYGMAESHAGDHLPSGGHRHRRRRGGRGRHAGRRGAAEADDETPRRCSRCSAAVTRLRRTTRCSVVATDPAPAKSTRDIGERRVGHVIARGPSVTEGYYLNPEATTEEAYRRRLAQDGGPRLLRRRATCTSVVASRT